MNTTEAFTYLTDLYSIFDWFDSVGLDKYNRYVVFVKYINYDVMTTVVPKLHNKQVLLQYSNSKSDLLKKKYGTVISINDLRPIAPSLSFQTSLEEEKDIDDLIYELDRLEKLCGSNILQNIFYETHDGKNAVTNLSKEYPYVRSCLEKLYDNFGFDVLYNELDG